VFKNSFQDITLAFFTAIAPSGAIALVVVATVLLFAGVNDSARTRLDRWLLLPLVVVMVGLVTSATHLGNPANALYLFKGVGRSPLSTEVFFAVLFLLLAGVYWLYAFSVKQSVVLKRIWVVLVVLSALAFVQSVAWAYNVRTIISWNTPWVPMLIWLEGLAGGPLLALLTLRLARHEGKGLFGAPVLNKVLLVVSIFGIIAGALAMLAYNGELSVLQNSSQDGADYSPWYMIGIVFYTVVGMGAAAVCAVANSGKQQNKGGRVSCLSPSPPSLPNDAKAREVLLPRTSPIVFPKQIVLLALSCLLMFAGIFVTRILFYFVHMTVGL
jgi:anaerobic dimethyl sulfoxide reductase subunit C (anchor subunit)